MTGSGGSKYKLRKAGVECAGESRGEGGDETLLGMNFANVGECFDACDRAARLKGERCELFVFGKGRKFGKCEWEHQKCDEFEDDLYDLYELTEFG